MYLKLMVFFHIFLKRKKKVIRNCLYLLFFIEVTVEVPSIKAPKIFN